MDPYRVILVVDRAFGARLQEVPDGTPVWVVDSSSNHPAIVAWRRVKKPTSHLYGLTSFQDRPNLSPADLAASVIDDIEIHHGVHSHQPPFSRLTVIGAALTPALVSTLEEVGFRPISAVEYTLEFAKKEAPSQPPASTRRDGSE